MSVELIPSEIEDHYEVVTTTSNATVSISYNSLNRATREFVAMSKAWHSTQWRDVLNEYKQDQSKRYRG